MKNVPGCDAIKSNMQMSRQLSGDTTGDPIKYGSRCTQVRNPLLGTVLFNIVCHGININ